MPSYRDNVIELVHAHWTPMVIDDHFYDGDATEIELYRDGTVTLVSDGVTNDYDTLADAIEALNKARR
jgi:hypothetical protein